MNRFYSHLLIPTAVLFALATGAFSQDLRIKARRVIRPAGQGGRLAWSVPRNLIAYDKVGVDGFYDIFTMRPDGSEDACITCAATALPGLNIGSPRWHPSGNWMVFVAQREPIFINNNARPGVGVANDVWIADYTLTKFWKVADTSGNAASGGVLHPTFSHAGDKLFWAERISTNGWTLKIADFRDTTGQPVLSNVRELKPPGSFATLYESHDFTPDDSKVLFSGNLEGQPAPRGIDIYSLDLTTQQFTPRGGIAPAPSGTSVMYRPGKILIAGSTNSDVDSVTGVIDMNQSSPAWRTTQPMANKRFQHNLLVLPDGKVLVVGGASQYSLVATTGVRNAE
ncbi:MAG: hypothetical protein ABI693_35460, partial [Bryobacteraceae bacterium]